VQGSTENKGYKTKINRMPHAYAISLTRPHEAFDLPKPFGRRVPRGIVAWNVIIAALTLVSGVCYVVLVNMGSAKSYERRNVEKRIEELRTETMMIQDKIVLLSSMQSLNTRAAELGFVPVDRLEFVNPAAKSYAMR
jgi:hypothetical protein